MCYVALNNWAWRFVEWEPIMEEWTDSFGRKYLSTLRFNHIRPKILSTLTFRLPPEVFIRRMKSSFLHPVLGTVSNRCAKKTVVCMTELVAALLSASYLLCQEPDEEMTTSFFWWRLPVEVETSLKVDNIFGRIWLNLNVLQSWKSYII